jgi:hypothetical protein
MNVWMRVKRAAGAAASSLEATQGCLDFGVACELPAFRLRKTFEHVWKVRGINFFGLVVVVGHTFSICPVASKESDYCEHSRKLRDGRGESCHPADFSHLNHKRKVPLTIRNLVSAS